MLDNDHQVFIAYMGCMGEWRVVVGGAAASASIDR
jgi:hypothetical protein